MATEAELAYDVALLQLVETTERQKNILDWLNDPVFMTSATPKDLKNLADTSKKMIDMLLKQLLREAEQNRVIMDEIRKYTEILKKA